MPDQASTSQHRADLRLKASCRLTGAAATKGSPGGAADALAVLHELAISPATATDALALLHELQVHQVELDLQAEELRASRTELESALRRQVELHDALPVACFTVDRALAVHELNRAAADLLGVARGEAEGLTLDGFLSPDGARQLRELIAGAATGRACAPATLRLVPRGRAERAVRVHLGPEPGGERLLLVLVGAGDAPASTGR